MGARPHFQQIPVAYRLLAVWCECINSHWYSQFVVAGPI
jgi:hypothetical protein